MSAEHCRHCGPQCQGSPAEEVLAWTILAQRHRDRLGVAEWDHGNCLACAESEQTAEQIAELAHRCEVLENGPEMLVRGIRKARALVIARNNP